MSEDNKDGELEITIDEVADKGNEVDIPLEPKNEPAADDWKAQFEAAKKRAEDAEAARDEAEKLARQREADAERVSRENVEVRGQAVSAEMAAIDNALANVEHERNDAKAKYKQALEAGDFDAAADAQDTIAAVAVKAQRIKEGKAALERLSEDAKAMADPVEKYVAKMTPQSASWVRSHPEVVTDAAKQRQLERAHYRALADDIRVDSPEYFKHMDQEMGYAARPADPEVRVDIQRSQAAPAAPVSRGGAAEAPQTRGTTIRLTAAQREIAALSGLTDAEYAKNLLAIQREQGTTTH